MLVVTSILVVIYMAVAVYRPGATYMLIAINMSVVTYMRVAIEMPSATYISVVAYIPAAVFICQLQLTYQLLPTRQLRFTC